MINIYNKQQILLPLECSNPMIFEETKMMLLNDIQSKSQIRIIDQMEGCPIAEVEVLTAIEDVENWFERYGFEKDLTKETKDWGKEPERDLDSVIKSSPG